MGPKRLGRDGIGRFANHLVQFVAGEAEFAPGQVRLG
jgi:hypothetical protein